MMTFPTEWKVIKAMFHTSNQVCSLIWFYYIMIMVGFAGLTKIKLLQPTVSQKQTCITLHNCQSPPKNNWLVVPTPLKNMKVSWDDHISNTWKDKKNMFQTANQYIYIIVDMQSLPSTQVIPNQLWVNQSNFAKNPPSGASPQVPCVSAPRSRYHSPLRVWGTSGNQVIQMGTKVRPPLDS